MLQWEMDDMEEERRSAARWINWFQRKRMRWNVHGTDAATGQPVTLAVDEMLATDAVQAALSKRIVVSHVTREGLRRALFPLACAVVVVLIPLCAGMYWYRERRLHQVQLLQNEEARLTAALTESEANVRDLKAAGASLVDYRAVSAANEQVKSLDRQLAAARTQLGEDRTLEVKLQGMTDALNAVRQHSAQLELNIKEQLQSVAAATAAQDQVRLDAMEKTNRELAGQIETLKSQLLVAAANSVTTAPAKSEEGANSTALSHDHAMGAADGVSTRPLILWRCVSTKSRCRLGRRRMGTFFGTRFSRRMRRRCGSFTTRTGGGCTAWH